MTLYLILFACMRMSSMEDSDASDAFTKKISGLDFIKFVKEAYRVSCAHLSVYSLRSHLAEIVNEGISEGKWALPYPTAVKVRGAAEQKAVVDEMIMDEIKTLNYSKTLSGLSSIKCI
uniref:Phage_int_SAM_5 domain-containing protein n=1 Tax=Angiostrongylus cantonensis TaxID=6313 RepID=A0A0K0DL39_ANGCA